jgi:hypothetical protein
MTALDLRWQSMLFWAVLPTYRTMFWPPCSAVFSVLSCVQAMYQQDGRPPPLFKKGDRSDPSSYRLIVVSLVVHRLFAGIVNTLLTRWCQKQNVFPKEQFGYSLVEAANKPSLFCAIFYSANKCWGGSNKRLWIAFIDSKAAYDHVDREALWHHLQHVIGVPPQLLTVIQNNSSGDA